MAHTHIYVWDRLVMSAGPGRDIGTHRHFGAIVTMSPEAAMTLRSREGPALTARAAVIAPNAWHHIDSSNTRTVNILVGPDHAWFRYVKPLLNGDPIVAVELGALALEASMWEDLFEGRADCTANRATVERILRVFGGADAEPHRVDPRIAEVLQMLRDGGPDTPTPDELGRRVGLSGFTLMRRFKAEVGVRIREYVLWRRLMTALALVDGRATIADIAQRTGFYDQAHLTRTVRRMVELAPSFINDFSQTRVHVCTEVATA